MSRTRLIVAVTILAALASATASAQSLDPTGTAPPPIVDSWTATGGPDGMLFPNDMAIDPEGRVWVADTGNDRFTILEPDGTFIETWGSRGSGDGQFRLERANGDGYGAIEFAPDGSFYVLDVGNRRVQHFGTDRSFIGAWGSSGRAPGQYLDPIALQVAPDGTVLVLECGRDVVEFYDPVGTVIGSIDVHADGDGGFNCANSMVTDTDGNIYVDSCCGSGNMVEKLGPDGSLIWTVDSMGGGQLFTDQPSGIDVDADGRIYVSVNGTIQVYDADGNHVAQWTGAENGGTSLMFPFGVLLDSAGAVLVADAALNQVRAFELTAPVDPG